jgi:hypothetical protein
VPSVEQNWRQSILASIEHETHRLEFAQVHLDRPLRDVVLPGDIGDIEQLAGRLGDAYGLQERQPPLAVVLIPHVVGPPSWLHREYPGQISAIDELPPARWSDGLVEVREPKPAVAWLSVGAGGGTRTPEFLESAVASVAPRVAAIRPTRGLRFG